MADVYLAIQSGPKNYHRLLALKVLRVDDEQDLANAIRMFESEGRLAALLNHSNIVQSHDVGIDGDWHYIAMEFLEGQSLQRIRERARQRSLPMVLDWHLHVACQILEGLSYAHALQGYDGKPLHMVHRDISPHNVFVTYAGVAKLLDFGIAKVSESSRTRVGLIKGKFAYMSPEQALEAPLDARSDLFSMGVVLWEAVAGRRMHEGLDGRAILGRIIDGRLPKIRDVVTDVSPQLERILDRALALDPNQRYQDAETFRGDLLALLEGRYLDANQIGTIVTDLFRAERAEIRELVRRAVTPESGPLATPTAMSNGHDAIHSADDSGVSEEPVSDKPVSEEHASHERQTDGELSEEDTASPTSETSASVVTRRVPPPTRVPALELPLSTRHTESALANNGSTSQPKRPVRYWSRVGGIALLVGSVASLTRMTRRSEPLPADGARGIPPSAATAAQPSAVQNLTPTEARAASVMARSDIAPIAIGTPGTAGNAGHTGYAGNVTGTGTGSRTGTGTGTGTGKDRATPSTAPKGNHEGRGGALPRLDPSHRGRYQVW
jgi:serine/threonine protein kinase